MILAPKDSSRDFSSSKLAPLVLTSSKRIMNLPLKNHSSYCFLANGLDWESIYPKENLELARNIIEKGGLLLSEYPVGQSCGRYGLVARDRLQAGLSYATVVIQTGEKGGTMHAVNATINSGKLLFAVEYKNGEDATHEKVQGNVKLIREGKAHPLRSASIDEAIQMCEKAYKTGSKQIQQTSLFD
jgi:DNA processing protein